MAGPYNPNDPRTLGLEWPAGRDRSQSLSHALGRGALFRAGVTETVDAIQLFLRTGGGHAWDPTLGNYILDVYNADDAQPGTVALAYSNPVALVDQSGGWIPTAGNDLVNAVNDYHLGGGPGSSGILHINNPAVQPVDSNIGWIRWKADPTFRQWGTNEVVDFTDKRIHDIVIGARVAAHNPWNISCRALWNPVGTTQPDDWVLEGGTFEHGQVAGNSINTGYNMGFNHGAIVGGGPGGARDAQMRDLVAITTSGGGHFGLWEAYTLPGNTGGIPYAFVCWNIAVHVAYSYEKRICVGYSMARGSQDSNYAGNWVNFGLENPKDSTPKVLNKTANVRYLLVARQFPQNLPGNDWRGLDAGTTAGFQTTLMPLGFGSRDIPFQHTVNLWPGLPESQSMDPVGTRMPAYVLMRAGAPVPDGSQPYVRPLQALVWNRAIVHFTADATFETQEVEQRLSGATAADDYGIVTVVVKNHSYMDRFTEPLVIALKRSSDNVQLASLNITFPDLKAPTMGDGLWYVVQKRFAAAVSLVAGTQYYLEASSNTELAAWELLILSSEGAPGSTVNFGGVTDYATVVDTAAYPHTDWDALLRLHSIPGRPNTVVIAEEFDVAHGLEGACAIETLARAHVAWDASTELEFSHFEVERSEDGGSSWQLVATLMDDPDATDFYDVEMLRNVPISYRVTQWRHDGISSDPGVFGPVIIPIVDWGVTLATNLAPDLTVAYFDEPGYEWQSVDATRNETRFLLGRDYAITLRETEYRGDAFERSLIVAVDDPNMRLQPKLGGRAAFDPLINIAHIRDAPYVVFADHRGRRWYTAPQVESMSEDEPGGTYLANVSFVEVVGPVALRILGTPSVVAGRGVTPSVATTYARTARRVDIDGNPLLDHWPRGSDPARAESIP